MNRLESKMNTSEVIMQDLATLALKKAKSQSYCMMVCRVK